MISVVLLISTAIAIASAVDWNSLFGDNNVVIHTPTSGSDAPVSSTNNGEATTTTTTQKLVVSSSDGVYLIDSSLTGDHEDVMDANYKSDYYIVVYPLNCSVLILGKGADGKYNQVVKVFQASCGKANTPTPEDMYEVMFRFRWRTMSGVEVQYATGIGNEILFHSIPYYARYENCLKLADYAKIGTGASHGCIRMCVRDARFIYKNIPNGTQVRVIADKNGPATTDPVPMYSLDPKYDGWDPTDWNKANPYNTDPTSADELVYYTHTSYASTTTTIPAQELGTVTVIPTSVNLRSGPAGNYAALVKVWEGQTFKYYEVKQDYYGVNWYFVYTKEAAGWLSGEYMKVKPADSSDSAVSDSDN